MTRSHLAALNTESAYRVPWQFERGDGLAMPVNCFRLRNLGPERLTGVTFNIYGSGIMPSSAPSTLEPSDALEIMISGAELSRDTIGLVRWFRPDDQEYLWRVSF
jgi:hypothetical protein